MLPRIAASLALGGLLITWPVHVTHLSADVSPARAVSLAQRWVSHAAPTPAEAGYVASGRAFRYAQAVVTVPAVRCGPGGAAPRLYVALTGPAASVRAGLACESGHWQAFAQGASQRGRPVTSLFPLGRARAGAGVFVSVSLGGGGWVRCSFMLPGGRAYGRIMTLRPAVFTEAEVLAGWAGAGGSGTPRPAARKQRLTQFLSGAFTTLNGRRGVFTGPWNGEGRPYRHRWQVTSVAADSHGKRLAAPGYLWTDGTQAVFGSWGDAFGVWLYP